MWAQITIQYQTDITDPKVLLYTGLSIIPVIIWAIIFYRKDSSPTPIRNIILTFFIGCFTVVPLLLYEYVFNHYYQPLIPSELVANVFFDFVLTVVLDFLSAMSFLALVLALVIAVLSIVLTVFYKETFRSILKSLLEESLNFSVFGFLLLLVIVLELLLENVFAFRIVTTFAGTFVLLAVMEEYVKHLVVRFIDDHRIRDIDDAIVFSIMVGLAFAFAENIKYFINTPPDELMSVFVGRSLFSIFAHILFSGIFGYYYGVAHFSKPLYAEAYVEGKKGFRLPRLVHKILHLRKSVAYREQKMMEGLVLATVIHAIFNVILELNLTFVIVPYLAVGYLFLSHLLSLKENQKQFGVIGSRALPEQEYEKLIWKISSIKWAEQIRKEREEREQGGKS